jgi:hypothetical protein
MCTCMNFGDMWLSAIVPLVCCRFWKPYRAGEVLPKFSIDTIMFLFFAGEAIDTIMFLFL